VVLGGLPRQARLALVLVALATAVVLAGLVLSGSAPQPVWSPLPEPA